MVQDFFQTYFIDPILYGTGYNPVNTTAYAVIFVFIVFCVYKILDKLKIKIDKGFFLGIFPFIILGSVFRVLEDAEIFVSYLFVTPLVYFIIFFLTISLLLISVFLDRKTKIPYNIILFSFGLTLCIAALSRLNLFAISYTPLLVVFSITFVWFIIFLFIRNFFKPKLLTDTNFCLLLTHLFDASTTFTALSFFSNYFEQHVLTGFLIDLFGPFAMFVLKIVVLIPVLWILDKEVTDEQQNNFLKLIVFILGFAPGLRNLLRMIVGV